VTCHFQPVSIEPSLVPQGEISDAPDEGRLTRRRSLYCIVLLRLTAANLRISFLGSKRSHAVACPMAIALPVSLG
jgi:hypothetical protein